MTGWNMCEGKIRQRPNKDIYNDMQFSYNQKIAIFQTCVEYTHAANSFDL